MGKILETLILNRLKNVEKNNNNLISEQFGFRESHSTTLQIARITDIITNNYNLHKQQLS